MFYLFYICIPIFLNLFLLWAILTNWLFNSNQVYNGDNQKILPEYSTKYDTKIKQLEDKTNQLQQEERPNNFIMENTPSGFVIMFYDTNDRLFSYYSNNTIPHKYLMTCAKKYALQFNASHLLSVEKNTNEDEDKDNISKKGILHKSGNRELFAKFKPKVESIKKDVETKQVLRFIRKGFISDMSILNKPKITNIKTSFTFADFKNQYK